MSVSHGPKVLDRDVNKVENKIFCCKVLRQRQHDMDVGSRRHCSFETRASPLGPLLHPKCWTRCQHSRGLLGRAMTWQEVMGVRNGDTISKKIPKCDNPGNLGDS